MFPEPLAWAEVGEQIQANGMPLKIFVARSKWKPVALLNHYQKRDFTTSASTFPKCR